MSGLYRVVSGRRFRGHSKGDVFHARLDPGAEARAVARGDIVLIERITPSLPPGYQLPVGWVSTNTEEG